MTKILINTRYPSNVSQDEVHTIQSAILMALEFYGYFHRYDNFPRIEALADGSTLAYQVFTYKKPE